MDRFNKADAELGQLVQQVESSLSFSRQQVRAGQQNGFKGNGSSDNGGLDQSPVARLIRFLLDTSLELGASDIHLEPGGGVPRIRFRIDGSLQVLAQGLPISQPAFSSIISRLKLLCRMDITETRLPQDGRFSFSYVGRDIDVRVSSVPLIDGEKLVLRLLNAGTRFRSIEGLDLSGWNKGRLMELLRRPSGAIILAGPVNSGKTTALYAMLSQLNTGMNNILTIEDPVEYRLAGINQLQVNPKAGLEFETAVKAVLRQDYDILALSETRSVETARMMVRSAMTGHLLLTTLHTNGAVKALYRLIEMGIPAFCITAAVAGIMAQRLLPGLCPHCREQYAVSEDSPEGEFLHKHDVNMKTETLYHSTGCPECGYTGYLGRIGIQELLIMDEDIASAIKAQSSLQELERIVRNSSQSFRPMALDGIEKAMAGQVDIHSVMAVCE